MVNEHSILDYMQQTPLKDMANAIRALAMDAVQKANSGHPGMPMGMADVATVLFTEFLRFSPARPDWPNRDRFILSAGHGSMLLYALSYLTGYKAMSLDQIKNFRQRGALTAGHPEYAPQAGIEMTTGPLGQGIATATGFALAERIQNARFGDAILDHKTYVIASDGDLQEGVSHESGALAGHLRLKNLIVLWDDNGISIDGPTHLSFTEDVPARYRAYGWHTLQADGHDMNSIRAALTAAQDSDRPTLIACKTTIGFGAPTKAGTSSSHGSPLGAEEIIGARQALGWPHGAFVIPDDILAAWRHAGARHDAEARSWTGDINNASDITDVIVKVKQDFVSDSPNMATRASSGRVLESLIPALPALIGGSADLTGSNNTKIKGPAVISADTAYNGQYIHYGVREHGMAAAMNGLALHGGIIPYGGTFLCFADYCRPSLRLAALMQLRVIHVMTHDSIGLGEDGPTHQPVEHLSALRAIPNLHVYRPCDGVETAECWQLAIATPKTPVVMALSRQNLPTLRSDATVENKTAQGGYILSDWDDTADRKVTIFATGSEVAIAMNGAAKLRNKGIAVRVVSVPCLDRLLENKEAVGALACNQSLKVAIEAGIRQSWDALIGPHGVFIGMTGFGESAPAEELYDHFGITADALVDQVLQRLQKQKESTC
ncbi:MAG: transketolase [Pseudomonadota bacterium]